MGYTANGFLPFLHSPPCMAVSWEKATQIAEEQADGSKREAEDMEGEKTEEEAWPAYFVQRK